MATFRILDQAPQYLLPSGKVNAGGSLLTFATNLTTPKLTWADPAKATPNPTTIILDAAGRTATDVWGDGEYGLVMKDAAGVTIWTRNNVRLGGDSGQAIPALVPGRFLGNDGSNLTWEPVLQVPDPTGSSGYILSNDGVNPQWIPQVAPAAPDIDVSASRVVIGDGTDRVQFLRGTGVTSTGVGTKQASGTVTYSHAFSEPVIPVAVPTGGPFTVGNEAGGYFGDISITAYNATGFTFIINTNHGEGNTQGNIIGNVTIAWQVFGPISDAP